jgi:hypothetical protein
MATDTDDLFRALAEDAGRARLEPPADLRRRSDRRTAARTALGTVAVVAVVAAVLMGTGALRGDSTRDLAPIDPASPTVTSPTVVPSKSPRSPVTTIPASAWLDAADLRVGPLGAGEADLPSPCGRALLPTSSLESAQVSETMNGSYLAPGVPPDFVPNGTISQTIVVRANVQSAAALMAELQAHVAACAIETRDEAGARYAAGDSALPLSSARPDDHLLIEVDEPGLDLGDGEPDPARVSHYVSVLRVADTLTFLTLRGWEASETDLADVQRLASRATVRLLDWRNQA